MACHHAAHGDRRLSDDSKVDITSQVEWSSEQPIVATVDMGGFVTSLDHGMSNIHAMYMAFDSALAVTVTVPTIAVTSYGNGAVNFFAANAKGNVAPLRTISGQLTTLVNPRGIAVSGQELFVTDQSTKSIDVFPIDGMGNIAPTRRIVGAATLIGTPSHVAVANNKIYLGHLALTVLEFPVSGSGNIAPSAMIGLPPPATANVNCTLTDTNGVALLNGELYVADLNNSIVVFPDSATGDVAPTRRIVGQATTINEPNGLTIIGNEVYVMNSQNSIDVFPTTGSGNIAPTRSITGMATSLGFPDMMVSIGNYIYSVNANNSAVQVYLVSDTGNVAPQWVLSGAMTNLSGCDGIVVF